MVNTLVELKSIRKTFGNVVAVDSVNLSRGIRGLAWAFGQWQDHHLVHARRFCDSEFGPGTNRRC